MGDFMKQEILTRTPVTLDFTGCRCVADLYKIMREAMKWENWYGDNLDSLWDILTGLPFYGDDFKILRPRVYEDPVLTRKADAVCDIFCEAQERFGKITVDIDCT